MSLVFRIKGQSIWKEIDHEASIKTIGVEVMFYLPLRLKNIPWVRGVEERQR